MPAENGTLITRIHTDQSCWAAVV